MRRTWVMLCWLGAAVAFVGCGGGKKAHPTKPDARATPAPPPDAALPVAPRAIQPLALGGGCRCTPLKPAETETHRQIRQAFVRRMDRLHKDLRGFMAALDRAVGDETKAALADPAPHRAARKPLVCQVDCLFAQFRGWTPLTRAWVTRLARYLDDAGVALTRLTEAPAKRGPGPGLKQLMAAFNEVARASNRSIGVALLASRPARQALVVDALSFRAKTRRYARRARAVGADFRARWFVPGPRRGRHPLEQKRVQLRAGAHGLLEQLADLGDEADHLGCKPADKCGARVSHWKAQRRALQVLETKLRALVARLRKLGDADLPLARCRALLAPVDQAWKAWHKALAELQR